ncbi:MAG TPA: peptidyl-prolyl cis-trans isomerase [Syntrophorhabdus sp.]|jgi:peptidyl-prolyl cis-trans isomerase SurA|nr:peptidyl-prolyl cis-trans isomerase [Syntrophorhabdus sp.]HQP54640.1 peptidyl-prolyl cis-trans isomerase [Syntrophorhabdus sp.]
MKIITCIVIVIISFIFPVLCAGEVMDRIIAIVNDDIITLKEAEKHVQVEKEGRFVSINEYMTNLRLKEKIDLLIDDVLIRQEAKRMKIDVEEKEVEGIIENIKKQYLIDDTELMQKLKDDNISLDDFKVGLKNNVLRSRLLNRVISPEVNVTEQDLRQYYDKHKEEFIDEEYRLQQIFVSGQREDAQKRIIEAYKLLQEGKPFEVVVKDFSDDKKSSATDGDIGFVKKIDLIPQLRDVAGMLSPGVYSSIITTPYGFHILKLVEKKRGETMTFEMVKDAINEKIIQEESEKRYNDYIVKLRKGSYIEVKI